MTEPRSLEEWVEKLERELADARRALVIGNEVIGADSLCGPGWQERQAVWNEQVWLARSSAQAAQPGTGRAEGGDNG